MIDLIDWLLIYLILNCVAFLAFAVDKGRAQDGGWRISEATLLQLSFFGATGAFTARRLLRHKTRKQPFRTQFQAIAVCHLIVATLSLPSVWPLALGWLRSITAA